MRIIDAEIWRDAELLTPFVTITPPELRRSDAPPPLSAAHLSRLIGARRKRERHFPEGLFSDPAWDVLLVLAKAHASDERETITNVHLSAALPATTSHRTMHRLESLGLVEFAADAKDRRRCFARLTPAGVEAMTNALADPAI